MQHDVKKDSKIEKTIEEFDCLCVGTSIIMSLEAIYQARLGKKVLMVDRGQTFGGAWKTIEICGIKDIENAIHYFLPDERGINFLRDELNWPIEVSKGKYRYFNLFNKYYVKISFSSVFGRFIYKFFYSERAPGLINTLKHFSLSLKTVLKGIGERSYYVSKGATFMLESLSARLNKHKIEMRFGSDITSIFFDIENAYVQCKVGGKSIVAKSLVLGHGARLPDIESTKGNLKLEEKFHHRPAFHLVVKDDKKDNAKEIILTGDPIIKYVHDVSRFSSLSENDFDKRKVFVFALQSNVSDDSGLPNVLLNKLKDLRIISSNAQIIASQYSDIILPTLYDDDLYILKESFGDLVNILRTENFSAGVGYYAERWKSQ